MLFIDKRLKGICAYCGAPANSRDHVPSKAFLDEPFPPNLPISESCSECNNRFSIDEEYLSCLIECVIHGTTEPTDRFRLKAAKTLRAKPSIAARIESGKKFDRNNKLIWCPEWPRVMNVVLKLARGHISYEIGLQHIEDPMVLDILPFESMSKTELERFNSLAERTGTLYPEIGSRAFNNLIEGKEHSYGQWNTVQDGRYRYAIGQSYGDWVKIVLSEYLACHVAWE